MTHTPLLCIPICAASLDNLKRDIERAAHVADIIELRLDCLADDDLRRAVSGDGTTLAPLLGNYAQSFILTLRTKEEGGINFVSWGDRFAFWKSMASTLLSEEGAANIFADIELALLEQPELRRALDDTRVDWQRIICSYHNLDGVPAALNEIYDCAALTPAGTLKVVVGAGDAVDCLAIFKLLERARAEGRRLIGIALGTSGLLTRLLAFAYGNSPVTFAALDAASATAAGQLAACELRDLYRIESITPDTLLTGLIGAPVAHSFSAYMHNNLFTARGIDAVYIPLEVRDLAAFMRRIVRRETSEVKFNWRGFSVTAPHKEKIIEHLDTIDRVAQDIGAVNTVCVEADGTLHGFNTDAPAVLAHIASHVNLKGARVAVIGAGGAARAALWSLRQHGAHATVFARDAGRARPIARRFDAGCQTLDCAAFANFDLVINTTSLGTRKADGSHFNETPARREELRGAPVVYDLVYNPSRTAFMREGEQAGCVAFGGLEMLARQAAAQWALWMNQSAPLDAMRRVAQSRINGEQVNSDKINSDKINSD